MFDGFKLVPVSPEDPVVKDRVDRFFAKLGQDKPWQHPDLKWFGLFKGSGAACIISVFVRPDQSLEVTNFYPSPTREGVKAGYVGMRLLKELVDRRAIPYWIGAINTRNKAGMRHCEKYFGIRPRCVVYAYESEYRP